MLSSMPNWSRQSFMNMPAITKACAESLMLYSILICPVFKNFEFTIKFNEYVRALISGLSPCCGPVAIFNIVALIIVASFDGHFHWSIAHVAQEVFEFFPLVANENTTTAVVAILLVFLIVTSRNHAFPNGSFGTVGHAVRDVGRSHLFNTKAAARQIVAADQSIMPNGLPIPTRTKAVPKTVFSTISFRLRFNGETAKNATSQRYKIFRHDSNPIMSGYVKQEATNG